MVRRYFHLLCLALIVGGPAASPVSAAQSVPSREVQQALERIGADLFSAQPRTEAAIKELKAILAADPDLAEGHMLLGLAYRAQGAPDLLSEAVAELRQALALKPSLMLARVALARVYLDMSRATRAREELESALAEMPGNPQLLSLLGETERRLGNPARAVELNRQALQANPSFEQARYYLGLALLDQRQYADAIREMQQVVKSGVNPAEASLGLGSAYLAAGRTDDAIAALREAARHDPSRGETHIHLSRAYRAKGLPNEALKQLKLAAPSAANGLSALYRGLDVDLHMEEGLVRMDLGQLEAAAKAFQRVLEADAGHAAAKQKLTEVRKRLQEKNRSGKPGAAR